MPVALSRADALQVAKRPSRALGQSVERARLSQSPISAIAAGRFDLAAGNLLGLADRVYFDEHFSRNFGTMRTGLPFRTAISLLPDVMGIGAAPAVLKALGLANAAQSAVIGEQQPLRQVGRVLASEAISPVDIGFRPADVTVQRQENARSGGLSTIGRIAPGVASGLGVDVARTRREARVAAGLAPENPSRDGRGFARAP